MTTLIIKEVKLKNRENVAPAQPLFMFGREEKCGLILVKESRKRRMFAGNAQAFSEAPDQSPEWKHFETLKGDMHYVIQWAVISFLRN